MDKEYLEFTALEDSTIGIMHVGNLHSLYKPLIEVFPDIIIDIEDNRTLAHYAQPINMKKGERLLLRGDILFGCNERDQFNKFCIKGLMSIKGNLNAIDPKGYRQFQRLFKDCDIINTPEFPKDLKFRSYYLSFAGCNYLVDSRDLSSKDIYPACYEMMFKDCINLIKAPMIHANNLANRSLEYMFSGCKSLLFPPEFPNIVSLSDYNLDCYTGIFKNTRSLDESQWIDPLQMSWAC